MYISNGANIKVVAGLVLKSMPKRITHSIDSLCLKRCERMHVVRVQRSKATGWIAASLGRTRWTRCVYMYVFTAYKMLSYSYMHFYICRHVTKRNSRKSVRWRVRFSVSVYLLCWISLALFTYIFYGFCSLCFLRNKLLFYI